MKNSFENLKLVWQQQIFACQSFLQTVFVFFVLLFITSAIFAQKPANSVSSVDLDENGVPVIVKHLPNWENAQKNAAVTITLQDLQKATGNRLILNEIDFPIGTEAVTARYDQAQMAIIEFPTPQIAIEVDGKIQNKLNTEQNTFYRKIGNYAVFVFDAPDGMTANTLLDNVNYEKTIQWLSSNPNILLRAKEKERQELLTTGDIILTVIKTAGLAVLAALGTGGLCGVFIFYRRRQEQSVSNAFSDAGGMLRLNLDDMTPQINSNRLLEK
jgi:hypothetical protein